ncbi:hypothetical protein ABIB82_003890 [Bradyrhizobium sp. i1.8.4]|uniref:hypothetical protein n=1 Tax=unclassified Bradyrhizobium TaxID=2631580 RepID=UPI003D1C010E
MSDVIEVSMTELDRTHGKGLMGQVCDQRAPDENFPIGFHNLIAKRLIDGCIVSSRWDGSGSDATRGETARPAPTIRRHQEHEIIR